MIIINIVIIAIFLLIIMAVTIGSDIKFIKANKKQVFLDSCVSNGHNQDAIAFLKDTKEIYLDGDIYGEHLVEIKWADLYNLYNSSKLVPGQKYRIIDYVTKVRDGYTFNDCQIKSAEHPFDIIVTAIAPNQIDHHAKCALTTRTGGEYFEKKSSVDSLDIRAWEIWYDIANNTLKYDWCSPTGTGVIYRMIDELGNDIPYDFKNIQFARYKIKSDILPGWTSTINQAIYPLMTDWAKDAYKKQWGDSLYSQCIIPGHNLMELADKTTFEWCYTFDYKGDDMTVMPMVNGLQVWMRPSNNQIEFNIDHNVYYLTNIVWKIMLRGDATEDYYSVHYNKIGRGCKHMTLGHINCVNNIINNANNICCILLSYSQLFHTDKSMLGYISDSNFNRVYNTYLLYCNQVIIDATSNIFIPARILDSRIAGSQNIVFSHKTSEPAIELYEYVSGNKTFTFMYYPDGNPRFFEDIIFDRHVTYIQIIAENVLGIKMNSHTKYLSLQPDQYADGIYTVEVAGGINITSGSFTDNGGLNVIKINDIQHHLTKYICYDNRPNTDNRTLIQATGKDILNVTPEPLSWTVFS